MATDRTDSARADAASLLARVSVNPDYLAKLSFAEWDYLLPEARAAGLLPRLAASLPEQGPDFGLPEKARTILMAAAQLGDSHLRTVRWELGRLARVLRPLGIPVLLLKGAAYVAGNLDLARGRLLSDVDIMVPRQSLDRVEQALLAAGWAYDKLDPYDQHYYRTWMHELPPLRHAGRQSVLDVHHTILPLSSRLHPNPEDLWRLARPLEKPPFHILAPPDLVLHSAAHLFQDGDLNMRLRDLIDIHDMLTSFGRDPRFWDQLVPRAVRLELTRPLYYALRYAQRLLATPVPAATMSSIGAFAPPRPVGAVMDRLIPPALLPQGVDPRRRGRGHAVALLYIRSHWLRMPPHLLAVHLARKAFRPSTKD